MLASCLKQIRSAVPVSRSGSCCKPLIPIPCNLFHKGNATTRIDSRTFPQQLHTRNVVARVAQRSLAAILAEIEELKASADALESELSDASKAAEAAAKRSRRLAARSHELQEYALEHVALGDEDGARTALLQKAAVADALRQAARRAEANSALARKLEEVLVLQHSRILAMIREANRQQAAAARKQGVGEADAAAARAAGRGLKRSRSVAWSSATLHASYDGGMEAADAAIAAAVAAAAAAAAAQDKRSSISS